MSIRGRLSILMLAIGLVPTLAVGAVSYIIIGNELTKKTVDQLASTASKQEQKISSQLQAKQEEAVKLTNRFDLQSALDSYRTTGGRSGGQEMYDILFTRKIESQDIQTIYVTDLDGRVAATTVSNGTGVHLAPAEYHVEPDQESTITLQQDQRDGINKLYITSKISINKKHAGYLTLIFRIDDIVATVQDYTGLGETGETVVATMDKKDDSTTSLFPLRFNTDAALQQKLTSMHLYENSPEPFSTETDYRGHEVIRVTRPIGFANWMMATKIDTSEILAPIASLRQALITIILISSAIIAAIAFYFTRFFTRPIIRIAEVAQRIGKGDLSASADVKRDDEVGTLATSINAMGSSLREFVSHIESQRKRLEIILNNTKESILAIDTDGVIIIANDATAQLTKLPLDQIVGKRLSDFLAWQQDGKQFVVNYDTPGTETYDDILYVDSEGAQHYTKVIVTSLSGEQEDTARAIITVHDETKDRDLENMKVDFVSMAAHELRTPLAAIRGYLELIVYKMGPSQPEEINRYLDESIKSTAELGGLITNLLDVTRIERGSLALHFEKVDLAADLQQVASNIRFNAKEKGIEVSYDGPAEGCLVVADQIGLHEVMNNLLSNAIKYTDPGGKVFVALRRQENAYTVDIRDTGQGMPKQALAHLFTKFYRVHGGLNSGSTGTGLGLYISKSIIERHGGAISVNSQEGRGSTFTFTLPVFDDSRLAALQISTDQAEGVNVRRKRGWTTQNIAR